MICAIAASSERTYLLRLTAHHAEHRWLDTTRPAESWSSWESLPFAGHVVDIAAVSGWDQQIEIFVLDSHGQVWNRWWWPETGWTPRSEFNPLGTPFDDSESSSIAALNAGGGHFVVFVEAADGRVAVLPHISDGNRPAWRRHPEPQALNDGWWPAFPSSSHAVYRWRSSPPPNM